VLIFIKRDDERGASRKKMGNYSIKLESLLVLCKMEGAVTESRVEVWKGLFLSVVVSCKIAGGPTVSVGMWPARAEP
jgi:hypothetical protein